MVRLVEQVEVLVARMNWVLTSSWGQSRASWDDLHRLIQSVVRSWWREDLITTAVILKNVLSCIKHIVILPRTQVYISHTTTGDVLETFCLVSLIRTDASSNLAHHRMAIAALIKYLLLLLVLLELLLKLERSELFVVIDLALSEVNRCLWYTSLLQLLLLNQRFCQS